MKRPEKLLRCEVIPRLPHRFDVDRGVEIPVDLLGSTIVRFGTLPEPHEVEGGGLIIDYIPAGETAHKRVIFGFTEEGMWVEYQGGSATPG